MTDTTTTRTSTNPYLAGNFAPVTEEVEAVDLEITGSLPPELEGRLLRIGPNPIQPPDPDDYHWFTGDGMVHGLRLGGGRAQWYRNRWVRSRHVCEVLGEEHPGGPFRMFDDTNTHIIHHAGRTLATVEAGAFPNELTEDLDPVGPFDFDGTLDGGFTAHAKADPATGELHAITYYWEWDHVRHVVVGADGRVRREERIPVEGGPMVHDCSITASRVLVYDLPVAFDLDVAMSGRGFPYTWQPDRQARVGVLPLDGAGDDVVWCEVEPCYVYHPLNAWDADDGSGSIVVDLIRHPKMFAEDQRGPNEGPPRLERWTVDPAARTVRTEVLDDRAQEFPRFDERLTGQRHRYGYTGTFQTGPDGLTMGDLLKHDLERGTSEIHRVGDGRAAMEPVFVPRHADAAEDDGWLLSYVYDAATDRSEVIVLAAQDVAAEPVARVQLPVRVPFGFHGSWVPTP